MESDSQHSTLGRGISFTASLPLSWSPVRGDTRLFRAESNEKMLRTIMALDEYPPEHSEEFAALDFKVNIVLELLAELVSHQRAYPPSVEVQLGADSLSWVPTADNVPEIGDKISVSLYLNPIYPRPLVLQGIVENLTDDRCEMTLEEQPDSVQMMLEKFIFLHHRRQVAQSRHSDN